MRSSLSNELVSPYLSDSEVIPLLQLQASVFAPSSPPAETLEQQNCESSYIGSGGVLSDSPWMQQIYTDHLLPGHSQCGQDVNLASQLPSHHEFSFSGPIELSNVTASSLETAPTMTLPMFCQHSPRALGESIPSFNEAFVSQRSLHQSDSISPFPSTASTEAEDQSNHGGDLPVGFSSTGSPYLPSRQVASELEEDLDNEPYARLIFRALMSAPRHRMVLKDIYEWFEKHTNKARDPKSRGWQNSIRHNLSMNGVSGTTPTNGN